MIMALNIDLTAIAGIWMGGIILLVPLFVYCLRFGLIPLIQAIDEYRHSGVTAKTEAEILERLRVVESRIDTMDAGIAESPVTRHPAANVA